MKTITINQFTRRFIAGYFEGERARGNTSERLPTNFLQLRQPNGSIAEIDVYNLNKKQAIEKAYREYLQDQVHATNISNNPQRSDIYMTEHGNPLRHAGCGGKIAYEVSPTDDSITHNGYCQLCGATGVFQVMGTNSSRFIIDENDTETTRVFANGIVDGEDTFRMIREDIISMLKTAIKLLSKNNPTEKITLKKMLFCLGKNNNGLLGLSSSFLYDFSLTLDPGEVLTFMRMHAHERWKYKSNQWQ